MELLRDLSSSPHHGEIDHFLDMTEKVGIDELNILRGYTELISGTCDNEPNALRKGIKRQARRPSSGGGCPEELRI